MPKHAVIPTTRCAICRKFIADVDRPGEELAPVVFSLNEWMHERCFEDAIRVTDADTNPLAQLEAAIARGKTGVI